MKSRDFALWMAGKLEGKEHKGLSPTEVVEAQKTLAGVLVKGAVKGGADPKTMPDPEKVGNGLSFAHVSKAVVNGSIVLQED
ncbi:MAG: hypothetical protein QOI11_58 [Candidatus Eremiobacteraeota bacterium]|jgi:hypothetical protein|nr:hypothetical protein [Candidatus Eremiobacteraeota bacterium]